MSRTVAFGLSVLVTWSGLCAAQQGDPPPGDQGQALSAGPGGVDPTPWDPISLRVAAGSSDDAVGSTHADVQIAPSEGRNAFVIGVGKAETDDEEGSAAAGSAALIGLAQATVGAGARAPEVEVRYLSAEYRRLVFEPLEHRYRIFFSLGPTIYDVDGRDSLDLGWTAKVAAWYRGSRSSRLAAEFELGYHQPDSDLDFWNFLVGVRLHSQSRR